MPYHFVEDVAISDAAFEATGDTLSEVMASAAQAVTATGVQDLSCVAPQVERRFSLRGKDAEWLLHHLLEEVIFLKDTERILLSQFDVEVTETPEGFIADVVARGERLDPARHAQVVDVKAATWHRFAVEHTPLGWRAFVVLDI